MSRGALSVSEAARRLGALPSEVTAALREGRFPGRFLCNGEMWLPAGEVESAVREWAERERQTVSTEVTSAVGDQEPSRSGELRGLRDDIRQVLKEERRALVDALVRPLEAQEDRLHRLEDEVRGMRGELRTLGPGSEASEWDSASAPPDTSSRSVDFRGLVQEIAELEALLGDLEVD